ncbi:TPA: AsnC family transcriptional regulator, partial [Candidatus Bathyarchaeota archaeon]|nr:AsnC family transcriptional regulator [Candidatus Bathyarchaeota archaeon]
MLHKRRFLSNFWVGALRYSESVPPSVVRNEEKVREFLTQNPYLKGGMKVDHIDERILRLLKENARMPYVKLAKKVGLSEGAVRRRIEKLIRGGVVEKFTIVTRRVGYVSAFVLVRTDPAVPTSEIVREIRKLENARDVCEVAGPYEVAFILEESSIDALNNAIESIRAIRGVI